MNLAHIHVVLNHIPSLGIIAAFFFLAAAIYRKNDTLKKHTFVALVLITLSILPTYVTGSEALRIIRDLPSFSRPMVELHQNAAMITLIFMTVTGTLAWFGLWEFRRYSRAGTVTSIGSLLGAAVALVSVLYTASLGGKVNHAEIRTAADQAVTQTTGWREAMELWVSAESWSWPAFETMHFIGMGLLFGVSLLLMLRMLGIMKSIPFVGIHRLLPLGIVGFVANLATGMVFFIATPGNYIGKTGFHIKIWSIVVAGLPLLYFTLFDQPWRTGANQDATAGSKFAAVSMLALLVVVVIYGRLLPFLF
jgi:hypothetical protein